MPKNPLSAAPESGAMRRGTPVVKPVNMTGTLLRLWRLTRGHRKGLVWILMLSCFASASSIFSPLLIGKAVNNIHDRSPLSGTLALLAGLYITDWLVRFLQQFFMASIGQHMILHIRNTLFSAMEKLPLRFFDQHRHGELMSRLTNDVDNISTTISDSLSQLMIYLFTITGIFCTMLRLNIVLTCISLVSVVCIFLLTKTITRQTRKLFLEQQTLLGKLNGQVEESISGLNMVKAYCQESKMIDEFEKNNEQYRRTATRALIWSGYLMPITNVINNLIYVCIAVVSGLMAAKDIISIGMISSFLLYAKQFSRPFVDIANIYNNFQTAVAGAERIFQIMDEEPEPKDPPHPFPLSTPKGDIIFSHVSFGYEPDQQVLKDINLHISAGTTVAIVGHTGSGKTTLINLLTRFYDVTAGQILLDGHDLREYKLRDLRKVFGVVLQDTALFNISVRDNISYGNPDVTFEEIHAAAISAEADSFISRLPNGYDTILSNGGVSLSQGERQLLTIARVVLANAPILVLDEATSSVDTVTEQKIRSAILSISAGRTSFIIAHRLSTILDSDLIILIENGKITEQGTHDELMKLNKNYAKMYRTQTGQE